MDRLYVEACSQIGIINVKCRKCRAVYNSTYKSHHRCTCSSAVTLCPYSRFGCDFVSDDNNKLFSHSASCPYGASLRCPDCGMTLLCCERLTEKPFFVVLRSKSPEFFNSVDEDMNKYRNTVFQDKTLCSDVDKVNALGKITLQLHKTYECPSAWCNCPFKFNGKQCPIYGTRSYIQSHMDECLLQTANKLLYCPGCKTEIEPKNGYVDSSETTLLPLIGSNKVLSNSLEKENEIDEFYSELSKEIKTTLQKNFLEHAKSCNEFLKLLRENSDPILDVALRDEAFNKLSQKI